MPGFLVTAIVMLLALVPLGISMRQGGRMAAVVAYEAASSVSVMVLLLLPQAFDRTGLFEFPVLLAVLLLGGGLVFVRALERWL